MGMDPECGIRRMSAPGLLVLDRCWGSSQSADRSRIGVESGGDICFGDQIARTRSAFVRPFIWDFFGIGGLALKDELSDKGTCAGAST